MATSKSSAHDAVKGREALRHQVVVRREMIVGQGLPVGQEQDESCGANHAISSFSRCASVAWAQNTTAGRELRARRASASASLEP